MRLLAPLAAPVLFAVLAGSLAACESSGAKPSPPTTATATAIPSAARQGAPPPIATTTPAAPVGPKVPMPEKADAVRAGRAINAFGASLYAGLAKKPGNFAFSPTSIEAALAMTLGGAKGSTATEMRSVLKLEGGDDAVVAKLLRALGSPGKTLTLNVANRLFGEKTFTFKQDFIDRTRADFDAPMEGADFLGSADKERGRINQWVEEKTARRIKDLLPPRSLDATTRMVLVNALYFLAEWREPFKKESTFPQPFKTPSGEKSVPTMHQRITGAVVEDGGSRFLELAYKGGEASMIIALPDAPNGLAALEAKLTGAKLDEWQAALAKKPVEEVDVALPKLTIEPTAPMVLGDELKKLGMIQAFDAERADFSGIGVPPDPQKRLFVSQVFHKAFVKVDEKGTEAAAATAVVMAEGGGMPRKAIAFQVDRPFLFFIVDKASGATLFAGRVVDPT
ncbi:MAG: serpin family protein [Polyangiaceae bacterium]